MKKLVLAALLTLGLCACATPTVGGGTQWRCDHGAAFSVRITSSGRAEVFAGGQTYSLPHVPGASCALYSNVAVEYWERGGTASLTGARAGPYTNCHH